MGPLLYSFLHAGPRFPPGAHRPGWSPLKVTIREALELLDEAMRSSPVCRSNIKCQLVGLCSPSLSHLPNPSTGLCCVKSATGHLLRTVVEDLISY